MLRSRFFDRHRPSFFALSLSLFFPSLLGSFFDAGIGLVFVALRRAFAFNLYTLSSHVPRVFFMNRDFNTNTYTRTWHVDFCCFFFSYIWLSFLWSGLALSSIWSFMRHMIWLPFLLVMCLKLPMIKMLSKLLYKTFQLSWHCEFYRCHSIITVSTLFNSDTLEIGHHSYRRYNTVTISRILAN